MFLQILLFIAISIYIARMSYFYKKLFLLRKRMPLRDTIIIGIVCIPLWPLAAPIVSIFHWINA